MKKTQEILGLPIISISDGNEVGKVKSIIINADRGAIDFIVVDSGIQILSARVIPTDSILGIGEYALTIESDAAINDISKIPAAIGLLQKNIQVKGAKVLTRKGRLIGEIGDIFVDEDECCRIIGLEYIADITQKRIRIIPRDKVITFGKNLVVVTEDVEDSLLDKPTQLTSGYKPVDAEKKNNQDLGLDRLVINDIEPLVPSSLPEVETAAEIAENQPESEEIPASAGPFHGGESFDSEAIKSNSLHSEESSAAVLFEQRQRQYLNGRRATKTVTDRLGNILVNEGAVITDEIIDAAKVNGKMIELVMNNKA